MGNKDATSFSSERLQNLFTEIAKLITSSLEVPKIIDAVMEQIELYFQPHNWSLLRLDPTTQELFFVIAKGIDQNLIKHVRLKLGEGIAGEVARTKRPIYIEDVNKNPNFSKKVDELTGFKTKSLMAVPIVFQNQVLGVIELINAFDERNFTAYELATLETIADFSAIALTNAIAYERIIWYSTHDALTKVYNRVRLEQLISELKNTHSAESNAIVALIDINNFKIVNDQYGHHIGDEVLCKTASLLEKCCNKNSFVFRTGGDEFLLVLTRIKLAEIGKTIDQLAKQLTLHSKRIHPAAGFSFGIAAGLASYLEQLMKEADQAMYQNKSAEKAKSLSHPFNA